MTENIFNRAYTPFCRRRLFLLSPCRELLRRRYEEDTEIFYYKDQSYDIDFCLVRHGKIVQLVQVAYTIEGDHTRKREVASLLGAGRKLNCPDLLLLTDHERETIHEGGQTVRVLPVKEWCTWDAPFQKGQQEWCAK